MRTPFVCKLITNAHLGRRYRLVEALTNLQPSPFVTCRNLRDCFFFDDVYFAGGFMIIIAPSVLVLAMKLSRVHDAFKIKEQIAGAIGGCVRVAGISNPTARGCPWSLIQDVCELGGK